MPTLAERLDLLAERPTVAGYQALARLLPDYAASLQPVRVALLASFTIEPLLPFLRVEAARHGFAIDVYVGPFNTARQELLEPSSGCAFRTSSFGSFSLTSGSVPTTNGRSALAPSALCNRSQYTPGTASAATATESLPLALVGSTRTPVPLTHAFTGQGSSVPAAVTSTVVPRWAPAG